MTCQSGARGSLGSQRILKTAEAAIAINTKLPTQSNSCTIRVRVQGSVRQRVRERQNVGHQMTMFLVQIWVGIRMQG